MIMTAQNRLRVASVAAILAGVAGLLILGLGIFWIFLIIAGVIGAARSIFRPPAP
jgi:hypothetical protein